MVQVVKIISHTDLKRVSPRRVSYPGVALPKYYLTTGETVYEYKIKTPTNIVNVKFVGMDGWNGC